MNIKALKILGLMSGSSLDGLDLALCRFDYHGNHYSYNVIRCETIIYPAFIKDQLKNSMLLGSEDLISFDHEYGRFIGKTCLDFLEMNNLEADYIASHGHTVFHDPSRGYTLQTGNGHDIAAECGIPVICDFRSMDVALGGQGAPLVPIGDELLFSQYDACLNLGGIANISFRKEGSRIAFDICPVNMALNELAGRAGKEFDEDGTMGRKGIIREEILNRLEKLQYYSMPPPKSLGKEWFNSNFKPLLHSDYDLKDIFHTVYEHISRRISSILALFPGREILVTGGGAHNSFLTGLLKKKSPCNLIIPDKILVDYKEALIFGFLGYLRIHRINNILCSATGAKKDSCGGVIIYP